MEHCCLKRSSILIGTIMSSLHLLTVAKSHGFLPISHVVSLHRSVSACRQQTVGVMVHGLQAGHAIMHIVHDSTGDFPQGFEIKETERVI